MERETVFHDLVLLYLRSQDLSSLTPEELLDKYNDTYQKLKNQYKENAKS